LTGQNYRSTAEISVAIRAAAIGVQEMHIGPLPFYNLKIMIACPVYVTTEDVMRKSLIHALILTITAGSVYSDVEARPKNYPKKLFSVSILHFDATRKAHGLEWYATSEEGKAVLGGIAVALGAAPAYVALAQTAIPPATSQGEQTDYVLPIPAGYAPCAAIVTVKSIVPADGPRGSTVNGAINPANVQISTWTPTRHVGEGPSWAEGDVAYFGIKPAFLDEFVRKGVCKRVASQETLISCRGRSCSAGGKWGDPSAAGKTTRTIAKN
jgi:hypothetical protein